MYNIEAHISCTVTDHAGKTRQLNLVTTYHVKIFSDGAKIVYIKSKNILHSFYHESKQEPVKRFLFLHIWTHYRGGWCAHCRLPQSQPQCIMAGYGTIPGIPRFIAAFSLFELHRNDSIHKAPFPEKVKK